MNNYEEESESVPGFFWFFNWLQKLKFETLEFQRLEGPQRHRNSNTTECFGG